ncbi:hypothetical protein F4778DRAFT_725572 [Xylariomycetidae sp. FL2044]|nr:hypothetical protein F4778DRAFT_725572 [Xylariomycetidae sp. FL2044]
MSEYTSTQEGFQRAMESSLDGPPEEAKLYYKSIATPSFYQIVNGKRRDYDACVKHIEGRRAEVRHFKPVVDVFLRDGDYLAAHMTGTVKLVERAEIAFESFIFAKVDQETGKMEWMKEQAVWGSVGGGALE